MPVYTIAYIPSVKPESQAPADKFVAACMDFVKQGLKPAAEGFFAGDSGAQLHIGLCRFSAPQEKMTTIWNRATQIFDQTRNIAMSTLHYAPIKGVPPRPDSHWIGFTIRDVPALAAQQQRMMTEVLEQNGSPLLVQTRLPASTNSENLIVHNQDMVTSDDFYLTLGYIRPRPLKFMAYLGGDIFGKPHTFDLAIGVQDKNWAYTETLYPASLRRPPPKAPEASQSPAPAK